MYNVKVNGKKFKEKGDRFQYCHIDALDVDNDNYIVSL